MKHRAFFAGLSGTLALWGVGALALRVVVLPAQVCPAVTPAEAVQSAEGSAGWIERAQQPDGSFVYEYNRETDQETPLYNAVRHAGVTMSLYMLAAQDPGITDRDPQLLPTADRGLEWMTASLERHDDWAALRSPGDGSIETGATALMLAGLAQRRATTHDTQYDQLMHELGNFLLLMEQPDGSSLLYWLPSTGAPDPAAHSKYATGESFWAITLMRNEFPQEQWEAPARRAADYLSNHRDAVEHQDYPPWADQWAAYGLSEMATWPLDADNIRYARSLADRFGFLMRVESQRRATWWSKLLHGRRARAAGMATWAEGLDSLWRLASIDPRMADMRDKIAERAVCGGGMIVDRQQTAAQAANYPQPSLVEGAWYTESVTRMDDQQHALAGVLRSAPVIEAAASGR